MKKNYFFLFTAVFACLSLAASTGATGARPLCDVAAAKTAVKTVAGSKCSPQVHAAGTPAMQVSLMPCKAVEAQSRKAPVRAPHKAVGTLPATALQFDYTAGATFSKASAVTLSLSDARLTIGSFGGYGSTVMGTVDTSTGAVTLPRQAAYDSPTFGPCDLVRVNDDLNSIDTVAAVTGTIADGVLTLDHWTLLITSGKYKGYVLNGIIESSHYKAPNTTMTLNELDSLGAVTTTTAPVYVEQTATNRLEVYNFLGGGYKYNIGLNGDSSICLMPQLLFSNSNYGAFYYYKCDPATKAIYRYSPVKGDSRGGKLAWGGSAVATSNGKYWMHYYQSCEIALPFTPSYPPAQSQAGFKGSGTQADPWLIENMADLIALSDSVNCNTVTDSTGKYFQAFAGRYFKQTKAINAKGYLFQPIGGNDDLFRFAGNYDGGNYYINNLTIDGGQLGYAGLFGMVDTTGSLKNIRLSNPTVTSRYYFTGSVAGKCLGTMENVAVTGGNIKGQFSTGGVAGYGARARQVSFQGNVSAEAQCGGVFGVDRDPVSFLSATGTTVSITATRTESPVGGLIGQMTSERGGSLSDSYFSGNVIVTHAGQYAGGLVGTTSNNTLSRCFSMAQIGATSTNIYQCAVGGLVGGAIATVINDSYFAGEIRMGNSQTGSIIGYIVNLPTVKTFPDHCTLNRCYVTGMSASTSTKAYMPYVGYMYEQSGGSLPELNNCYYDRQLLPLVKSKNGALWTTDMTAATGMAGYSDSVWTFAAGQYPALKSIAGTAASYVSTAAIQLTDTTQSVENIAQNFTASTAHSVKWSVLMGGKTTTEGHGLTIEQGGSNFVLNGAFATDTIVAASGTASKYCIVKLAPASQFEGQGTAQSPFLLKTKADLVKLSKATEANKMSFAGTHFLITNDIDMEQDPDFKGIGYTGTASDYAFGGILDGAGHTIHNVRYISCTAQGNTLSATTTDCGFVNSLKAGGVVKNLRLASDCYFEFYSRSAAVVGYNFGGDIINCRTLATVIGHSGTVAGITSFNAAGSTVRDCYNGGSITAGYQYAAGIVGNNRGLVENCENTGDIATRVINGKYAASKTNTAGGVVHTNFGTVRNVLNAGHVYAPKYAGGIMAWYNSADTATMVSKAVNVGIVDYANSDKANTIGNIVGKLYHKGKLASTYYDAQLSTHLACQEGDYAGASGLTTASLTSGKPLDGLDTAYWSFEPGKYPMLKTFADEPGAQAAAMSVVYFDTNSRSDSIKHDCALYRNDGLTWTMASGKQAFAIDGGYTLWMDPAPVLTDTLVATASGYVKRIAVTAVPDSVPLPEIEAGTSSVDFKCALDGVTFYYTLDGSTPTTASASTTGTVALDKGDYNVAVIAVKHNYYPSQVATAVVTATAVNTVASHKAIERRYYVTPSGLVLDKPATGVNIVVTRYTDGSQSVTKTVGR